MRDIALVMISAIIGSLLPIIFTRTLKRFGKSERRRDLFEYVYKPLNAQIEKHRDSCTLNDFLPLSEDINRNRSEIVPEWLKSWYDRVKRLDGDKQIQKDSDFFRHVETNYNWLKKKLGYDFDTNKIEIEFLFFYNKRRSFLKAFHTALQVGLSIFLVTFYVSSISINKNYTEVMFACGFVTALYFTWIISERLTKYLNKWGVYSNKW